MKLYNFFGIISLFPLWAFRSNLENLYILLIIFIFFLIPYFIHLKILNAHKKNFNFFFSFWLSLLFVYAVDQNIGLWTTSLKILELQNISNYIKSFLFLILFFSLTLFVLLVTKKNGVKIFISIILTIFYFNILDKSRNFSNFNKVKTKNNFYDIDKKTNNQKLVIILDEMSGINSDDTKHSSGKEAKKSLLNLFKKNNFKVYTNIYSIYGNTKKAIPSILNFITSEKEYKNKFRARNKYPERRHLYLKKSKNYFQTFNLTKNSFFDLDYINKIIVYQSMYLNFCDHKKVFKCFQYNPFDRNVKFLKGFKNNFLTKTFSAYKNNASATSNIIWRLLRHLNIIDSVLEPEGQKASFKYILDNISKSLKNNNIDLVLAHILVPHVPYAFNKKCEYEGSRGTKYNFMSLDQKRTQHNLERVCVAFYLDNFFQSLKKDKIYNNLEITIFSDHDSRISKDDFGSSVIFAEKLSKSSSFEINSKIISSNEVFKKNYYYKNNNK